MYVILLGESKRGLGLLYSIVGWGVVQRCMSEWISESSLNTVVELQRYYFGICGSEDIRDL